MKARCACALFVLLAAVSARAADWAEWRGPTRNGIVAESPPLLDQWPAAGPTRLWKSEEAIPSGGRGGYGSPVVADGRVYLFVCWKYKVPLTTRTLSARALQRLGWSRTPVPEALLKKVEAARLSEERAKLKGRDARNWAKKWLAANLDKDQQKKFGRFAGQRLGEGKEAIALDVLDKLATIKDKPFDDQAALDKWLAENRIEGNLKKRVAKMIPVDRQQAHDTVVCLDAATGKTLWKKQYAGAPQQHGSSSTPCVAGGRCYVAGSDGGMYCLDAKTGDEVWTAKVGRKDKNSSFLVLDGVAIIPAGPLTGFDAATGKVLWSQKKVGGSNSSPVVWKHGGKTYVIVAGSCVDPKTGDVLWKGPRPGNSTPAVVGDRMAVLTGNKKVGVVAYKLTKAKPEKLWNVPAMADRGASALIADGHVYATGSAGAVCLDLETGKLAWQEKKAGTDQFSSPILADGKLFTGGRRGGVVMLKASPEKCEVLGKVRAGTTTCTSVAVADGKLYARLSNAIACYDISKKAE